GAVPGVSYLARRLGRQLSSQRRGRAPEGRVPRTVRRARARAGRGLRAMTIVRLFPTQIWIAKLAVPAGLNPHLLPEGAIFRKLDDARRAWSKDNYPSGYTSYSSIQDLPERSTTFERLRALIDREVARYARALDMDLRGRRLVMTTCWLNAM